MPCQKQLYGLHRRNPGVRVWGGPMKNIPTCERRSIAKETPSRTGPEAMVQHALLTRCGGELLCYRCAV